MKSLSPKLKKILIISLFTLAVLVLLMITKQGAVEDFNTYGDNLPTVLVLSDSMTCIECVQMMQVLKNLSKRYEGIVNVQYYNVLDDEKGLELRAIYEPTYFPTVYFLSADNVLLKTVKGHLSKGDIEKIMRERGWI